MIEAMHSVYTYIHKSTFIYYCAQVCMFMYLNKNCNNILLLN